MRRSGARLRAGAVLIRGPAQSHWVPGLRRTVPLRFTLHHARDTRPEKTMTQDIKPVRRIVTIDDQSGASHAVQDSPSPDVRTDPARPGYASTRIWATTASPPVIEKQFRDALLLPHMMEPPAH